MSYEACEIAEVYSISEPRARAPYKCCECKAPIQVGEKHVKVFMVYLAETESHRQHTACAQVCEAIRDSGMVDPCLAWGSLKEWWWDEGRFIDKKLKAMPEVRRLYAQVLRRERRN